MPGFFRADAGVCASQKCMSSGWITLGKELQPFAIALDGSWGLGTNYVIEQFYLAVSMHFRGRSHP